MKRPILLLRIIGITLAVAAAIYFGLAAHNADTTSHLANGIAVTPIEVPRDDITDALDMHIWKFDIVMPDTKHFCVLSLNAYAHGKFVRSLAGTGFAADRSRNHLTISLMPINGDMYRAQQVRCVVNNGSGGTSTFFPNPFRNIGGLATGLYVSEKDNRIYLMGGGKQAQSPAGFNDLDIALDIKSRSLIPSFPASPK